MRVNAGSLAQALDQVQAAVFEPSLWLPAIEAISTATGSVGANIMEPTGRGAFGAALCTDTLEDLLEGYLREEWNVRDFRAQLLRPLQQSGVIQETKFVSKAQFDQHEY